MSKSNNGAVVVESDVDVDASVDFNPDTLLDNARDYRKHKRLIDAISTGYDSPEDALAAVRDIWIAFEGQSDTGGRYTPDKSLGFGSDSAAVIADKILGRSTTTSQTRTALAKMGQVTR